MSRLELVKCRLAIQICIGYFPDGRERHRTFSLQNVRPDATADALASVVRAIAPLLAYPITRVTLVKKYALVREGGIGVHLTDPPARFGGSFRKSDAPPRRGEPVIFSKLARMGQRPRYRGRGLRYIRVVKIMTGDT
jgi:hypothetical protein